MKPICVPCQRFFRPKKNGVEFVEGMPKENRAPAGRKAPELWQPYKLWQGDEWECPDCRALIIVGTGRQPIRERHHDDFEFAVNQFGGSILQVNDC